MLTERELLNAIEELERATPTYERCQKLVTFYTLYDFMYGDPKNNTREKQVVGSYGESEFMNAISGKDSEEMWAIMDELMSTLAVLNPKLYRSVMLKLAD